MKREAKREQPPAERATIAAQIRDAPNGTERMAVAFYGTSNLPPRFQEAEKFLAYGQRRQRGKTPRAMDAEISRQFAEWLSPRLFDLDADFFDDLAKCVRFFKRHTTATPRDQFYKDRQRVILLLLNSPIFLRDARFFRADGSCSLKRVRERTGDTFAKTDDKQLRRLCQNVGLKIRRGT